MTRPVRYLVAVLLASALASVVATRGFDQFNGVRSKVVTTTLPAVGGAVDVLVANRGKAEALRPPFALIARLRNDTADTASFSVDVDGQRVCERRVAPHTAPPDRGAEHQSAQSQPTVGMNLRQHPSQSSRWPKRSALVAR